MLPIMVGYRLPPRSLYRLTIPTENGASSQLSSPQEGPYTQRGHPSITPDGITCHKRRSREDHNCTREQKRSEPSVPPRSGYLHSGGNTDTNRCSIDQNGHDWPPPPSLIQSDGSVSGSQLAASGVQLAEALNCETHNEGVESRPWNSQPTPNDDHSHNQCDRDSSNTITVVTHVRKCNFSNRTKTGCLICRRRKKKCDEAHPICKQPFNRIFGCDSCDTVQNTDT